MKQSLKFIVAITMLISCQNLFGQDDKPEMPPSAKMYHMIADLEYDLIVRINRDMKEEELRARIRVMNSFDASVKIDYSWDESGNIRTLKCTNSGSSCESDDFGYLIVGFENGREQ